jgi:G protein-coupled receptor 158
MVVPTFVCLFSDSRVNLTYRVKSAHKLKLTDKQLLQWLFPILLVMIIYLSAWTVSDPPQVSTS